MDSRYQPRILATRIEWDDHHWNGCASSSLSYSSAEVIHGARNDTTFAPFVGNLFPIDSSKMLKAQNLPLIAPGKFS